MESLLIVFLGVSSLFSLSNALKCYVCLGFRGKHALKTEMEHCLDGAFSLNPNYLEEFKDGLYCLKHEQKLKLSNSALDDIMSAVKRGVVRQNQTDNLYLAGKCMETGPGDLLPLMPAEVLKSTVCYCRTDGCNLGCTHHPPNNFLPIILPGFLVIWSASEISKCFTL